MGAGGSAWRTPTRIKLLVTGFIIGLSILLELVVHFYFGIGIIYTHFFYPILILAAFWYYRKAVYIGLLLTAMHISIEYLVAGSVPEAILVRAGMFVIVAFAAGYLFERLRDERSAFGAYLLGYSEKKEDKTHFAPDRLLPRILGQPGDVEHHIAHLRSRNPDVRYEAAGALGELGDTRAIGPLAELMHDEESGVRWMAADALAKMGAAAVEPLIQNLRHGDVDVRWMAALALGDIGDPRAVLPLIHTLKDEDAYVRSRAALALGKIGALAREILIRQLAEGDDDVRWGAVLALGKIAGAEAIAALINALGDSSSRVRQRAARALGEIGAPAIRPLILAFGESDPATCDLIAEALSDIGKTAVPPLIEALHEENWRIRRCAAEALGRIGDPRSVDPLIEALRDSREEVRETARNALRNI
ncbi:hypothetical protein ASZ90_009557 [hydrocarbon metagenome]|uniref:HEAT repeat domain-containing protein n=1 Tax=hydrocarbon metagenome TaxID=938273 RepID=A0A0W8FIJ2_9ZZZZ